MASDSLSCSNDTEGKCHPPRQELNPGGPPVTSPGAGFPAPCRRAWPAPLAASTPSRRLPTQGWFKRRSARLKRSGQRRINWAAPACAGVGATCGPPGSQTLLCPASRHHSCWGECQVPCDASACSVLSDHFMLARDGRCSPGDCCWQTRSIFKSPGPS